MKKATFEHIQKRYSNMCNLYWFRMKALYNESGLTKVTFDQFYEWEKKDKELLEYRTVMNELFYICHLEGKKSELNDQPTARFAKEFMNKFYTEIYQTEGLTLCFFYSNSIIKIIPLHYIISKLLT